MIALLQLGSIGWGEGAVVVFLAFLLFGADKLPVLSRNAGRALHHFRRAFNEVRREIEKGE